MREDFSSVISIAPLFLRLA